MDRDRLGGSSLQHPVMWDLGRVRGHTLDLDGGLEAGRTGSLSSLAEWVMVITKRRKGREGREALEKKKPLGVSSPGFCELSLPLSPSPQPPLE